MSRRAVLGGGAALALAAGGTALARVVLGSGADTTRRALAATSAPPSHAPPSHAPPSPAPPSSVPASSVPASSVPSPVMATTTTTAVASPIPGVTLSAVPPRTRPVFALHDYLPAAPANAVALTIDDGPDRPWTLKVLAILAEHNVKATFSLVGVHVYHEPDLVRQIVAAGHGVCNHSMTHPQPFASLPQAHIDAEIAGGLQAIHAVTGRVATLFRSPGGEWSPGVFATAARWGMTPIDWNVDPRDWARPGTTHITAKMLAAKPGDILLCHDGGGDRSETVTALRTVLPALLARGLQFVTL